MHKLATDVHTHPVWQSSSAVRLFRCAAACPSRCAGEFFYPPAPADRKKKLSARGTASQPMFMGLYVYTWCCESSVLNMFSIAHIDRCSLWFEMST